MIQYVCGFLFNGSSVLLVEKNHPEWQKGLLNGIGGKVDIGEPPDVAIRREFFEETGLVAPEWQRFASETRYWGGHGVSGIDYEVIFYRAKLHECAAWTKPAKNDVGELLYWFRHDGIGPNSKPVGNLRWLIPLARDWRNVQANVVVNDAIVERPTW